MSNETDFSEGELLSVIGMDNIVDGEEDSGDVAEDQMAGVADHGGLREMRDLGIGNYGCRFDLRGELAQAGAEDNSDGRREGGLRVDVSGGGLGSAVDVGHMV